MAAKLKKDPKTGRFLKAGAGEKTKQKLAMTTTARPAGTVDRRIAAAKAAGKRSAKAALDANMQAMLKKEREKHRSKMQTLEAAYRDATGQQIGAIAGTMQQTAQRDLLLRTGGIALGGAAGPWIRLLAARFVPSGMLADNSPVIAAIIVGLIALVAPGAARSIALGVSTGLTVDQLAKWSRDGLRKLYPTGYIAGLDDGGTLPDAAHGLDYEGNPEGYTFGAEDEAEEEEAMAYN